MNYIWKNNCRILISSEKNTLSKYLLLFLCWDTPLWQKESQMKHLSSPWHLQGGNLKNLHCRPHNDYQHHILRHIVLDLICKQFTDYIAFALSYGLSLTHSHLFAYHQTAFLAMSLLQRRYACIRSPWLLGIAYSELYSSGKKGKPFPWPLSWWLAERVW